MYFFSAVSVVVSLVLNTCSRDSDQGKIDDRRIESTQRDSCSEICPLQIVFQRNRLAPGSKDKGEIELLLF